MKKEKLPWFTYEDHRTFSELKKDSYKAALEFLKKKIQGYIDGGPFFLSAGPIEYNFMVVLFIDLDNYPTELAYRRSIGTAPWVVPEIISTLEIDADFIENRFDEMDRKRRLGQLSIQYLLEAMAVLDVKRAQQFAEKIMDKYPSILYRSARFFSIASFTILCSTPKIEKFAWHRAFKSEMAILLRDADEKLTKGIFINPSDIEKYHENQYIPTEISTFFSDDKKWVLDAAIGNCRKFLTQKLWLTRAVFDLMSFDKEECCNFSFQRLEQDLALQEAFFLHKGYSYHIVDELYQGTDYVHEVCRRLGVIFSNYAERRISKKGWRYTFSSETPILLSFIANKNSLDIFLSSIKDERIKNKLKFILLLKMQERR